MRRTLRKCALAVLLVHHAVVWFSMSQIKFVHIDDETRKKLRVFTEMGPRFLTNWNFFNQTTYMFIALLTEFKFPPKYEKQLARLKKINWYNYWSIVLPWSIFIAGLFWAVYNYDRELIFPKMVDRIFPTWMNHAVHTNILMLIVLELFIVDDRPPRLTVALKTLTGYALLYVFVLVFTFFNNQVWLYGFIRVLDWPQRIVMFLMVYVFLAGTMWTGISMQNYKHRSSLQRTKICDKSD